jgi:hypothetical protein
MSVMRAEASQVQRHRLARQHDRAECAGEQRDRQQPDHRISMPPAPWLLDLLGRIARRLGLQAGVHAPHAALSEE